MSYNSPSTCLAEAAGSRRKPNVSRNTPKFPGPTQSDRVTSSAVELHALGIEISIGQAVEVLRRCGDADMRVGFLDRALDLQGRDHVEGHADALGPSPKTLDRLGNRVVRIRDRIVQHADPQLSREPPAGGGGPIPEGLDGLEEIENGAVDSLALLGHTASGKPLPEGDKYKSAWKFSPSDPGTEGEKEIIAEKPVPVWVPPQDVEGKAH